MNTVIETLQNNLPSLNAKYPLLSLGIFGSYSRGEETPNSDLDVLYEALPGTFLDLYHYIDLKNDLAELTHLKIDLVKLFNIIPTAMNAKCFANKSLRSLQTLRFFTFVALR